MGMQGGRMAGVRSVCEGRAGGSVCVCVLGMVLLLLGTLARDRRTSSFPCVLIAPWRCFVFDFVCVWVAQCSLALEVLQDGFGDVLKLTFE